MKWRNPKKELPCKGDIVWVLEQHSKEHNPRSCELMCGEVEWALDQSSCRVQTDDFTGQGSFAVYLFDLNNSPYNDLGIAWIHSKDFILPSWVPHNKHWGEINT